MTPAVSTKLIVLSAADLTAVIRSESHDMLQTAERAIAPSDFMAHDTMHRLRMRVAAQIPLMDYIHYLITVADYEPILPG